MTKARAVAVAADPRRFTAAERSEAFALADRLGRDRRSPPQLRIDMHTVARSLWSSAADLTPRTHYVVRTPLVTTTSTINVEFLVLTWVPLRAGIWDVEAAVLADERADPLPVGLYQGDKAVRLSPQKGLRLGSDRVPLGWALSVPVIPGVPERWSIRYRSPNGIQTFGVADGRIVAREQR